MATAGVGSLRTMDKAQASAARASGLARMLTGAQGASVDQLVALACGLLDAAGLTAEQRIDVLGGAFVSEAVRPHWATDETADHAHAGLRRDDEELADAVEAVAKVMLGRSESREIARLAIAELDRLLAVRPQAEPVDGPAQRGLFEA